MSKYATHVASTTTPKSKGKVLNAAGGEVFKIDDLTRLDRFLILGAEGGTYYASERKLTRDNAKSIERILKADPIAALTHIRDISVQGRAPKNDPAIFALALAATSDEKMARHLAASALPSVCRIPTHLFDFLASYDALKKGYGRRMRWAIQNWLDNYDPDELAFHMAKYPSRNGWSWKDVLNLGHPKPTTPITRALYKYAYTGELPTYTNKGRKESDIKSRKALQLIKATERAKHLVKEGKEPTATNIKSTVALIKRHGLSREMVSTAVLKSPEVWEALLEKMPPHAMLRNLGNMTRSGLLKPGSSAAKTVVATIDDAERMKKARVHPMVLMLAGASYKLGRNRRDETWEPVGSILTALDDAFYKAFANVEPCGKSILVACDVSGSMTSERHDTGLLACDIAAAMALVALNTEKHVQCLAFSTRVHLDFNLEKRMTIAAARAEMRRHAGGTDLTVPYTHATKAKWDTDAYVLLTDNETWANNTAPEAELMKYRKTVNPKARNVIVSCTATGYSVGDPKDEGTLQVVGFDTDAPRIISEFVAGRM